MTVKNILWSMVVVAAILGVIAYLMVWQPFKVFGWNYDENEQVTICHCETPDGDNPFQCQTLTVGEEAAENHIEQHENDSYGECEEEYSTPYSTPYETPYNYPTPDEYVTPYTTPEEYPTPYSTPYATPAYGTPFTVVDEPDPAGPPICIGSPVQHAPTILEVKRLAPDSVYVNWSTTDTTRFHVYYGFVGQELVWSTVVEGQSTTLDNLPEDSPLDVKVCSIGTCGDELCGQIVDP